MAAEAQSRLMTSRVYNMTDDRGVKDMLQFNLARDTYHQQQWLLGIEQLIEDGLTESGIENSNGEDEKDSLCPKLISGRIRVMKLPGGHHFDGNYGRLAKILLDAARAAGR